MLPPTGLATCSCGGALRTAVGRVRATGQADYARRSAFPNRGAQEANGRLGKVGQRAASTTRRSGHGSAACGCDHANAASRHRNHRRRDGDGKPPSEVERADGRQIQVQALRIPAPRRYLRRFASQQHADSGLHPFGRPECAHRHCLRAQLAGLDHSLAAVPLRP